MNVNVHYCTTCANMVPDDGVHSCFDAAERAVIDAAVVMADHIRQPPTTNCYNEWRVARDGLLAAVATLRELEGE